VGKHIVCVREISPKKNRLERNIYSVLLEGESNKVPAHTRKEALAAVTVPWGLINAGFNFAICAGVETRIPLSAVTVTVRPKTNKNNKALLNALSLLFG